ncbi:MAG TPA: N-acetylmuramoyl-L-alanine amidase [Acidimicrobiia bacterium]
MEIANVRTGGGLSRRTFIRNGAALAVGGMFLLSHSPRAGAVTVNPRSSWALNRPPKGPLSAEDVKFLLVHHSASQNGHTGADAPDILRAFYDFHTGPEKGWNDIAYNFLIDADGGIWEGRSGSLDGPVAGDATGGNQGFSQLVCVIGDYNSVAPSVASKNSLAILLAWLADRYAVDTSAGATVSFVSRGSNLWPAGSSVTTPTITGHRTMSQTTCPGDNLYSYVTGSLWGDVNAARNSIATTTAPATSSAVPIAPAAPSPAGEGGSSASIELTTTLPDPTPTYASALGPTTSIATTTSTAGTAITSTTTTVLPLATETVTPPTSPFIWGGLGLVGLASALLVWRLNRTGG